MLRRWLAVLLAVVLIGLSGVYLAQSRCRLVVMAQSVPVTVVLDAGHGGEDGGAVAFDGTNEKDINFQITGALSQYFDWLGIPYLSVRDSDSLIGDNSLATVRERKVSDIHSRMALVNETPEAILLSIHQNFFTSEQYWGAQVFYAKNVPSSAVLAETIQHKIANRLQPDNNRQIKPTEGTVYLLDRAEKTSVMVECGFLSNPTELERLKNTEYQSQLAYLIAAGVCEYINNSQEAQEQGSAELNI